MSQRIVYEKDDGGVSVVVPAPDSSIPLNQVIEIAVPAGAPHHIIEETDLPDRVLRGSWRWDGERIYEDLPLAVEIAHDRRRKRRASDFAPHDAAVTIPDQANAAERERVRIRAKYEDMQNQIDAAQDVDSLKAIVLRENI